MSTGELAPQPAAPSIWPMYRAMVGVGVLCGLLIVTVYQVTAPVIAQNRAEFLREAIFRVLPAATSSATFELTDSGFVRVEGDAEDGSAQKVYAGYDDNEQLIGVAVEARGMGYADVIALIYGYSFSEEAIVGIQVLESKETPGLGDKIETDPEFLANFERLDVSLDADGSGLANRIVAVKSGEKTEAWEVDGITGATISSVAIAKILDESAERWIPEIRRHLGDMQGGE